MNEQLADFVTILLQAVIAAVLPVALGFGVAWLRGKMAQAQQVLTVDQQRMIRWVLQSVVMAAEQSGLSKLIANEGKAKKEWAVGQAASWLESIGLPVDVAAISAQIEAILLEFKNGHAGVAEADGPESYTNWRAGFLHF